MINVIFLCYVNVLNYNSFIDIILYCSIIPHIPYCNTATSYTVPGRLAYWVTTLGGRILYQKFLLFIRLYDTAEKCRAIHHSHIHSSSKDI